MYALCAIAFENNPRAMGEAIRYITLRPPADSPATVHLRDRPRSRPGGRKRAGNLGSAWLEWPALPVEEVEHVDKPQRAQNNPGPRASEGGQRGGGWPVLPGE
jgi:hypothetical protein